MSEIMSGLVVLDSHIFVVFYLEGYHSEISYIYQI